MRGLLIFCCSFLAGNAYSAEGARCETKSPNVQQCAIPITAEKHRVKLSDQLSAIFNTYNTARSTGIFIRFQSGKDVLRRVYLSFNEADKETGDRMTVDLRKKIRRGAILQALEFEGTQESVTVRLIHQKDGNVRKVNVFEAN